MAQERSQRFGGEIEKSIEKESRQGMERSSEPTKRPKSLFFSLSACPSLPRDLSQNTFVAKDRGKG